MNLALSLTKPCEQSRLDELRQHFARVLVYEGEAPYLETPFLGAYKQAYAHWHNGIALSGSLLAGQKIDQVIAAEDPNNLPEPRELWFRQLGARRYRYDRVDYKLWSAWPEVFLRASQFFRFAKYLDKQHLYVYTSLDYPDEMAWDFWLRSQQLKVLMWPIK